MQFNTNPANPELAIGAYTVGFLILAEQKVDWIKN